MKFVVIFFLAGNPSAVIGVPVYGGHSKDACAAYASDLIRNIKRGAEIMGAQYTPIEARCEAK